MGEQSTQEWGKVVFDNKKYPTTSLIESKITFGRNRRCNIVIPHPVASGQHCDMTRDKDNVVFLQDTSTNGTWVNGKLVGKGKKVYMNHGDIVHLVRPSKIDSEEVRFTLYLMNPAPKLQLQLGKYDVGNQLGVGSFAKVHLCMDTTTGEKYAIKIIDKKRVQINAKGAKEQRGFLEEVNILKRLSHPNIIKVVEAIEKEDALYIILELVTGGDLLDKMIEMGEEFPEDRARVIFIQILSAVIYLHSVGIVHRDLKPENILLVNKKEDKVKLTDFGLSRIVGEGSFMQTICGTPMYVAPEVIANMGQKQPKGYGKAVDVWSLGVILYMLLCGEPPFDQRKTTPILEQVTKGEYHMPEDLQQSLSPEARDLVSQLLQVDVKKRLSLDKIATHPWVGGDKKLVSREGAIGEQLLKDLAALSLSSEKGSTASPKSSPTSLTKHIDSTPTKALKPVDASTPLAPGRYLGDRPDKQKGNHNNSSRCNSHSNSSHSNSSTENSSTTTSSSSSAESTSSS